MIAEGTLSPEGNRQIDHGRLPIHYNPAKFIRCWSETQVAAKIGSMIGAEKRRGYKAPTAAETIKVSFLVQ